MKKFLVLLLSISILSITGLAYSASTFTKTSVQNLFSEIEIGKTYQEILETGIQSKISPDYEFPTSFQYLNGCYAFAINHILIYKYGSGLDLLAVEKEIEKPRVILWKKEYVERFLTTYNIDIKTDKSAENLFKHLSEGEPIAISYRYPLSEDPDDYVVHKVAAYSFDENGIWISETLSRQNKLLEYSKIFDNSGKKTIYPFTTVEWDGTTEAKEF